MSEVLTDEEVKTAWGNSNFGPKGDTPEGRLELLAGAMQKVHQGHDPGGSFMAAIVAELGLVRRRTTNLKWALSYKGQSLLIESLMNDTTGTVERVVCFGEILFSFDSEQRWVNKAQSWFRKARVRPGTYTCVDAVGRVCTNGGHFMQATKDLAYPITVYRNRPED